MIETTIAQDDRLLVLRAAENNTFEYLLDWHKENISKLNSLLQTKGFLLFRGFDVSTVEKFECYLHQLPSARVSYIDGNSPRTKLSNNIYTSTEFPPEYSISMHNELSYSQSWPKKLYFCCVTPPQSDGQTLVADSRKVLQDLDASITEAFSSKQVKYTRFLHSGHGVGPSWQQTFESNKKDDVEKYCTDTNINYQWNKDGSISLSQIGPGTILHPKTGEKVWFNQADQFHTSNLPKQIATTLETLANGNKSRFPTYSYFGDGTEIPTDMLSEIRDTFKRNTIRFTWEKGDLLVIDNVLAAHGRAPFTGKRKILVAMT